MVAPFLGSGDSVWGTRTTLTLSDFFRQELSDLAPAAGEGHSNAGGCCSIVVGIGAGLCSWDAPMLYVELLRNEIQYRMRAEAVRAIWGGAGTGVQPRCISALTL